jgi:hypothetical protein
MDDGLDQLANQRDALGFFSLWDPAVGFAPC